MKGTCVHGENHPLTCSRLLTMQIVSHNVCMEHALQLIYYKCNEKPPQKKHTVGIVPPSDTKTNHRNSQNRYPSHKYT